jgi:hypothetical protein
MPPAKLHGVYAVRAQDLLLPPGKRRRRLGTVVRCRRSAAALPAVGSANRSAMGETARLLAVLRTSDADQRQPDRGHGTGTWTDCRNAQSRGLWKSRRKGCRSLRCAINRFGCDLGSDVGLAAYGAGAALRRGSWDETHRAKYHRRRRSGPMIRLPCVPYSWAICSSRWSSSALKDGSS